MRHRLSRAGDRQPNCALHTMAITQIGRDTPGRALLPNGNAPPERVTGKRCAAGRGGSRTSPVGSFSATRRELAADPGGHLGAALSPCAAG
ncbi:hypothetical protein [Rhodococcus opacus]|uniref:hypothetical protein n=1 Tax=Rhodococcus opacus TaxID=37919 RepID=UPI003BB64D8F